MKIFKHIAPLKEFLKELRLKGKTIGLVPTMGALHKGHLALIKASQKENSHTVCSIFVNPAQFNNPADLRQYPRTMDRDTELLKEVQCDILFCPDNHEIYPVQPAVHLDFGNLDKVMEGEFRPGHFSGVGIVVAKLVHIVEPDRAYFGQKDWQQFAIIKQLVEQLNFNLKLYSIPTLREPDGLALSSRNLRLSSDLRPLAPVFFKALTQAREKLKAGEKIHDIKKFVREMVEERPGVKLEYFEVADSQNLKILENVNGASRPILCVAGTVGEIRLIDNLFLD